MDNNKYNVVYIKTYFDNMVLPYFVSGNIEIEAGKWYIVNTKFGEDIGLSKTAITEVKRDSFHVKKNHTDMANETDIDDIEIDDESILDEKQEHIPIEIENNRVISVATEDQIKEREYFAKEELKAFYMAKKEIGNYALEMKLINVHFLLNKKKVIFNFTADKRIDFRQLVKKLASIFKTRIEMRQIGVRDAAKILGGYGVCGEIACCLRSNSHINSIFLKMAKDQGFVINSSKLTGLCGRLMCCLAYENDFYVKEKKKYPEIGSFVNDGNKEYRIFSINILKNEIYASDTHHRQKKFSHESIKFVRKDGKGVSFYSLQSNFIKKYIDNFERPEK